MNAQLFRSASLAAPRRGQAAATWLLCAAIALQPASFAWAKPAPVKAASRPDTPMTIDLVNAEIASAVQAVAAATGRNFIVDPRVKGKISLQFTQPVPPEQVYLALLTQLRLAGYAVVGHDGVFKVVPESDARLQTTPVGIGEKAGQIPGRGDQVVTQIFQLRNQSANTVLPVLRPLISPNNTINVDPDTNALVITDYADNLKRLALIIAGLDMPTGSEVDVVPLHYALASELAPTLEKLIAMQNSQGPGAATAQPPGIPRRDSSTALTGANGMRAVVAADNVNNALIVRAANGAQLMQIEQMIAKLDRPGVQDESNIHVVYLRNATATSLAAVLRGVLANLGTTGAGSGPQGQPQASSSGGGGGTFGSNTQSGMSAGVSSGGAGSSQGMGAAPDFKPTEQDQGVSLPQGGAVYADRSMNALIVNAAPPLWRQLRGVIQQLDVRRSQVYVEALIAEVDAGKAAQLGIQWQGLVGSAGGNNGLFGGSNFNYNNGGATGNIVGLQGAIASGTAALSSLSTIVPQGLNIGLLHRVGGAIGLSALANFLQTQDGANILSAPNLMTLDNEDAKIVVGQNVPFITGSYSQSGSSTTPTPFNTYERHDVGLTLKVRPQITAGSIIKMDVYQEVSSIDQNSSSATNGLITNKRSIQTSVLVDDGQTIVLGGLMEDSVKNGESKIPGLGDIPGLGALFRSRTRQLAKTDLLVFLRPVIVRDAADTAKVSEQPYLKMQQMQNDAQLPPSLGLPNLPNPILPNLPPTPAASTPPPAASVPTPARAASAAAH